MFAALACFCLLLFCVFVFSGCLKDYKDIVDEMKLMWDSCNSVPDLANKLNDLGFKYAFEGTNLTPWTDIYTEPEVVYVRGYGNCNDYTYFFQEFIKHKTAMGVHVADEFVEYKFDGFMSGAGWHYVTLFRVGQQWYEQSNLKVYPAFPSERIAYWTSRGYKKVKVTKTWSKP